MNKKIEQIRVAIIADWLTNFGGAEQVVQSFCSIFPQADLFTSVFVPEQVKTLGMKKVQTSFLQKYPKFVRKKHQFLLPLLPRAIESLNVNEYDLVLSSSSFIGKGVITQPQTLHICYCHTPTRYLWDGWQEYIDEFPLPWGMGWGKKILPMFLNKLRIWDQYAAQRPDVYIANSSFIAQRIQKYYRQTSTVISPPVDIERFQQGAQETKQDFYLALGRLIPYKRFDLLISTFGKMPKKRLKIVGKGPDQKRLKKLAEPYTNIEFLGFLPDEDIPKVFGRAKGFLFPQIEDAGIAPMEAMAAGTPVIAYERGGALDVIKAKENGIFFPEQSPESLKHAIEIFEKMRFDRQKIMSSVEKFSECNFERKLFEFSQKKWEEFFLERKNCIMAI